MGEKAPQGARIERRIERNRHAARVPDGEVGYRPRWPILHADGDPLAVPEAGGPKGFAQRLDTLDEAGVGQDRTLIVAGQLERDAFGAGLGMPADDAEIAGFFAHGPASISCYDFRSVRSEKGGSLPRIELSERRFRDLVAEALDGLPDEWAERLDNIAVVVEEEPSPEDLAAVGMGDPDCADELLGLYHGIPQDERGFVFDGLPDRVVIYRGPVSRVCSSRSEVVQAVRETVLHELGHHFGLLDDDMPY